MPKRSNEEVQALMERAFALLDKGVSREDVAAQLHVTSRTIYRWIKARKEQPPEVKAQKELAQIIYNPQPKLPESEPIETSESTETLEPGIVDLQNYHRSQKFFAIGFGMLAGELLPRVQDYVTLMQAEDINPRSIPSLIKAISEAVSVSSDCWARACGLDQVLDKITKIEKEDD